MGNGRSAGLRYKNTGTNSLRLVKRPSCRGQRVVLPLVTVFPVALVTWQRRLCRRGRWVPRLVLTRMIRFLRLSVFARIVRPLVPCISRRRVILVIRMSRPVWLRRLGLTVLRLTRVPCYCNLTLSVGVPCTMRMFYRIRGRTWATIFQM